MLADGFVRASSSKAALAAGRFGAGRGSTVVLVVVVVELLVVEVLVVEVLVVDVLVVEVLVADVAVTVDSVAGGDATTWAVDVDSLHAAVSSASTTSAEPRLARGCTVPTISAPTHRRRAARGTDRPVLE